MVVSFLLRSGAIFIACVSILLVVLEKQLPVQDSLSFEELPQSVQLWHKRGFYVKVFDHQMFLVQSGPTEVDEDVVVFFHGFPCSSFDYQKRSRETGTPSGLNFETETVLFSPFSTLFLCSFNDS